MKKNRLIIIAVFIAVLAVALCACAGDNDAQGSVEYVQSCFQQTSNITSATQTIEVKAGDSLVNLVTSVYTVNGSAAAVKTTTKTLNSDIFAEEAYTTETVSDTITMDELKTKIPFSLNVKEEQMTNMQYVALTGRFSFGISAAVLTECFGISEQEAATVKDASVSISVKGERIAIYKVIYSTTNGNDVVISTSYSY